ncbi:hypothetical protein ACFQH6_09525 [Halobacteriaceae archaeon GCM10025711]
MGAGTWPSTTNQVSRTPRTPWASTNSNANTDTSMWTRRAASRRAPKPSAL